MENKQYKILSSAIQDGRLVTVYNIPSGADSLMGLYSKLKMRHDKGVQVYAV